MQKPPFAQFKLKRMIATTGESTVLAQTIQHSWQQINEITPPAQVTVVTGVANAGPAWVQVGTGCSTYN